jgi:Legionella pneumophila major outer membrane protein precursor
MVRSFRWPLALAVALVAGTIGLAQTLPPPTPAPDTELPPPLPPLPPPPPVVVDKPPPPTPPATVTSFPHPSEEITPLPSVLDPLLDRPPVPTPGLFTGVELDVVKPRIINRLSAPVTAGGITDTLDLPPGCLGVTVSPRFTVGYRLPNGFGEFLLSYRFLDAAGRDTLDDLMGPSGATPTSRTRLDMHVVDLAYGSEEYSLGPKWGMRWEIGTRLGTVFYDTRIGDGTLALRTSNFFVGAGPEAGLSLTRSLGWGGLGLYGSVNGSVLIGQVNQHFVVDLGPDGAGETVQRGTQAVPSVAAQAGLSWAPASSRIRMNLGYQFEQYFDVGSLHDSRGDVQTNGFFVTGQFNF